MSGMVVVGVQWGDEGKGKIVDMLAPDFDVVVRFQGGNNAGHTVRAGGVKYVLSLIPSGIVHPNKKCCIGNGVVLDPEEFCREMDTLIAQGVRITPDNLHISRKIHLIMPYHKTLDQARESSLGEDKIGTTGRGIGPCYEDKAARIGIRLGDLEDRDLLRDKIRAALKEKNVLLTQLYRQPPLGLEETLGKILPAAEQLCPFLADVPEIIRQCWQKGGQALFEGAQGTHLDIDHGTYPFVTSSNTVASGAATGSGIAPWRLTKILGISKAYSTRVGAGPFPTELMDENGQHLREQGAEFGTVTGRPRRCGWLDAVILRNSTRLNGLTEIAITKLDVLSGLPEVKICTAYNQRGEKILYPPEEHDLAAVEPVYVGMPGWAEPLSEARSLGELPGAARDYLKYIEELCGLPVKFVSVGPDREQTIIN
ncbi:MAG: adenylosuccinate synthase [Desulfovibrionaceae bacterium]|nr:adenylosuccinate synthase [Desulfovibrionaceae bacterium]